MAQQMLILQGAISKIDLTSEKHDPISLVQGIFTGLRNKKLTGEFPMEDFLIAIPSIAVFQRIAISQINPIPPVIASQKIAIASCVFKSQIRMLEACCL